MTRRRRKARLFFVLIVAAVVADVAQAQTRDQVQSFPADYFAPAHPADAYDMVRRLPGFELIAGDSDVRGFTGSRGNVLFDGRAPSGKQESLEQMLRRIPASTVLRIELIRGSSGNAATAGYDVVANVIRKRTSAFSGSVLGGALASNRFGLYPEFRAELSRQSGEHSFDMAAAITPEIDDDSGRGSIIERDRAGNELGVENRDEREFQRTLSVDSELKLPLAAGSMVANANVARETTRETIRGQEGDQIDLTSERERLWSAEAGVQYRLSHLLGGNLEALALHRFERLRREESEAEERFRERTRTSETIARVEYRRGSSPELFGSIEASLNRLSSDNVLEIGGEPVDIGGSDVEVDERRGESSLGAIFKPLANTTLETSLRVEDSTIRSTGDSPQREHFLFWKPRVRFGWNHGGNHMQVTLEREAAQLNFSDFVASAELDRDEVTAGAIALRPATTWSASLLFEKTFWGAGSASVTFRQEWIDDVIDRVITEKDGEIFDAIGNIGKGRRTIINAELTLPFEPIGIPGMQLRSSLTFLKSRVTDPITGGRRMISEDRPFEGELRLIHDLPGGRWSWGVEASFAHREREFRFDQTRLERKGTAFGGHVEFRPQADWRVRFEAANLTSRDLVDVRSNFDGSRAAGNLESVERRMIRTVPIFSLTVRKAFGNAAD